jgi:hypothetical protein
VAVQPHHPGFHVLGEGVGTGQVLGPDVGGEAILGVVGQGEGFVVVLERGDRDDGPEDFLLEDPGVGCNVGEHRGRDVVAVVEPCGQVLRPAAAGKEPAFGLADLHVGSHLFVVFRVDQGAHLGLGVVRVAHHDVFGPGRVLLAELVVDCAFHEDAGTRGAAFPIEGKDTEQSGIDGGVQVGVSEHDARGLSAQLHGQALEVLGRVPEDGLPGGGLSGEGDQRNVRVPDQRVAGFLAQAVDQVEDAVWQAGFLEDGGPQRGGQWGEFGGFEDHRVSRGEGGGELPGLEHERGVPRRDEPCDADRFAVHVVDL